MNYIDNKKSCRCDIFKPSGKWYETIAIEFDTYFARDNEGHVNLIHESFKNALYKAIGTHYRNQGFHAVCLEPYHELSHPLMIEIE